MRAHRSPLRYDLALHDAIIIVFILLFTMITECNLQFVSDIFVCEASIFNGYIIKPSKVMPFWGGIEHQAKAWHQQRQRQRYNKSIHSLFFIAFNNYFIHRVCSLSVSVCCMYVYVYIWQSFHTVPTPPTHGILYIEVYSYPAFSSLRFWVLKERKMRSIVPFAQGTPFLKNTQSRSHYYEHINIACMRKWYC